jgi:hypothetical protein
MNRRELILCALAAAAGIGIFEIALIATSVPLRVDWGWYGTTGLALICLLAAGLGYFAPRHPWRWGLLPIIVVPFWILWRAGAVGSMWPPFAIAFTALSIPPILAAYAGAWLHRRRANAH